MKRKTQLKGEKVNKKEKNELKIWKTLTYEFCKVLWKIMFQNQPK
jgi:hypothetical protein